MTIYKDLKIGSSVNGTSQRYTYNITSSVSSVSGADANGNTLAYDSGFADVYLNGVRLSGADITITSGNSVSFASNLSNGDVVDIVAYGAFTVASVNADNLSSGTVPSARVSGAYTGITQVGTLTGLTTTGNINLGDSDVINLGASNDLQIFHSNSGSFIKDAGTSNLFIDTDGNAIELTSGNTAESMGRFVKDGAVELYHNNIKKFETTSAGATVTGNLTASGNLTSLGIDDNASVTSLTIASDGRTTLDATNEKSLVVHHSDGSNVRIGMNNNTTNSNEIAYEGTDFVIKPGGTEKARLTSTGLGIGHTSPSCELDIRNSSTHVIQRLVSANGSRAIIQMGDASDAAKGGIEFDSSDNSMQFNGYDNGERARIDSSGNLLVGKTSSILANVGHELNASSYASHTRDGDVPLYINRKTSFGTLLEFRKDNTAQGVIGSNGNFFIADNSGYGLSFDAGSGIIYPCNSSGTVQNNVVDLGHSSYKWKDLHLGGGVYLGGNKLDDYEEGTWTPAFNAGSAGTALTGSVAYSYYNRGYYTKIGRAVTVNFHANMSNKGTGSGDMWLAGSSLPFASSGVYTASMYQPIFMTKSGQNTYTGVLYGTFDANGGMRIGLYNANANISFVQHSAIGNDFTVSGLFTYFV